MAQTSDTVHVLRPRTPVRAWVLVGLLLIAGAVLLVVGLATGTRVGLLVTGGVLLGLALVLAVVTGSFMATGRLQVSLDAAGYQISGPGYRREGSWREVDSVRSTPDGMRLVIASGPVRRDFIQAPGGVAAEQMAALISDIAERLRRAKHS